jgi:hypothetical protein
LKITWDKVESLKHATQPTYLISSVTALRKVDTGSHGKNPISLNMLINAANVVVIANHKVFISSRFSMLLLALFHFIHKM